MTYAFMRVPFCFVHSYGCETRQQIIVRFVVQRVISYLSHVAIDVATVLLPILSYMPVFSYVTNMRMNLSYDFSNDCDSL